MERRKSSTINLIPLETNDSVIIDEPVQILIKKGYVYVADNSAVYKFDMEGRVLASLRHRGKAPDDYLSITDIQPDETGNIWILYAHWRKTARRPVSPSFLFGCSSTSAAWPSLSSALREARKTTTSARAYASATTAAPWPAPCSTDPLIRRGGRADYGLGRSSIHGHRRATGGYLLIQISNNYLYQKFCQIYQRFFGG